MSGTAKAYQVFSQFTVPTVTCPSTTTRMTEWAGIDGAANHFVEQGGIGVSCGTGKPAYFFFSQLYPAPAVQYRATAAHPEYALRPGDRITVDVQVDLVSSGDTPFERIDVYKNDSGVPVVHVLTQLMSPPPQTSGECIVESGQRGGVVPLAKFTTAHFSTCHMYAGVWNDSSKAVSVDLAHTPLGKTVNGWRTQAWDSVPNTLPTATTAVDPYVPGSPSGTFAITWRRTR